MAREGPEVPSGTGTLFPLNARARAKTNYADVSPLRHAHLRMRPQEVLQGALGGPVWRANGDRIHTLPENVWCVVRVHILSIALVECTHTLRCFCRGDVEGTIMVPQRVTHQV